MTSTFNSTPSNVNESTSLSPKEVSSPQEKNDTKNNDGKKTNSTKLLPQSKFGLGSDHGDMIIMLIKYFRIVAMVYGVWLIGERERVFNFRLIKKLSI
jgi:hypothetical protein